MKHYYQAYTKSIDGITFYFVKEFCTFPEFPNVAPVLENIGMHTDFEKACAIANVLDKEVQQQLLEKLPHVESVQSPLLHTTKSEIYKFNMREINFPYLLKLLRLR